MDKLKMHSKDLTQDNLAKIQLAFPNCMTERKNAQGQIELAIDFDLLRQELTANIVEGPQERYRLDWPGKREAMLTANAPIAKTLRPARDESVNFDSTENLFIEGDNLDALKLLQETYLGKVKMIYIDPPYNTGSDLIYDDDFSETHSEYLVSSNQTDEQGNKLVSNLETNGRFHSDWLSMIYPRLKLARNLLSVSGVIFISIDEGEIDNLKNICNEIFGEKNYVSNIIWQSRTSISNDKSISPNHNHTLVYAKNHESLLFFGEPIPVDEYKNHDEDPRGPWKLVPLDANKPGGETYYPILNESNGTEYYPPNGRSWAISRDSYDKLLKDNRIKFGLGDDSAPKRKLFLNERLEKGDTKTPSSILLDAGTTKDGTNELMGIFNNLKVFDYPKPTSFITRLLNYGLGNLKNEIFLDFFCGSGSSGQALIEFNAKEKNNHKFILVQIPEVLTESLKSAQGSAKKTLENAISFLEKRKLPLHLTEVTKYRLKNFTSDSPEIKKSDFGFRVLKVDTSNMQDVYYQPQQLKQAEMFNLVDNIKADRTSEDLLFQVLLDWGVDLTLPIRREILQGKEVFIVDDNALVACFEQGISEELIHELAALNPLRAVFRDNGFATDAVKVNVTQIFKQRSPITDVKSI